MAKHISDCQLRWADMDVYGVINNVVFLRLLEEARVDLFQRLSGELLRTGYVVVRHEIEYRRPLVFRREPVQVELWVSSLQAASVAIESEVRDGDRVCALASTTMAPYNYDKRFPRRFTEAETEFFQQYLDERRALG
jgi:acyl-CoA thioester hydrolase